MYRYVVKAFFVSRQAASGRSKKEEYNTTSSLTKPGHIDRYDTADYLRADSLCLLPLTSIHALSLPSANHCGNIHSYRLYHSNPPTYLTRHGAVRRAKVQSRPVRCIEHSITGTPYMNKVLSRSTLDRPNLPYIPDRPITYTQCTSISNSNSNTFIFTLCICSVASLRVLSKSVRPSDRLSVPSAILKPTYLYLRILGKVHVSSASLFYVARKKSQNYYTR